MVKLRGRILGEDGRVEHGEFADVWLSEYVKQNGDVQVVGSIDLPAVVASLLKLDNYLLRLDNGKSCGIVLTDVRSRPASFLANGPPA